MKFQLFDVGIRPVEHDTGEMVPVQRRLDQVVKKAVLAEEVGFESVSIGERHAGEFVFSAPPVVLGALAQATKSILLTCGVTILPFLDPVKVAEDYATVDQLSGGRLEMMIGKGVEDQLFPMFGRDVAHRYDYLVENYEILRRLLHEENVCVVGAYHTDLQNVTTFPRPISNPIRIWHGSATSTTAVDLAARWGDPVFTANVAAARETYAPLVDRYRDKLLEYGHDPSVGYVGAGSGGLFIANTEREAVAQYRPMYENMASQPGTTNADGTRGTAFPTIEDAVARGPALVGTSEQIAEKIIGWHASYHHDVQSVLVNPTLPYPAQRDAIQQFAGEVIPLVRRELSTSLWGPQDGRGPLAMPHSGRVAS